MISPPEQLPGRLRAARFLAVDPGTRHPACAIYDRGALVAASRVKVPTAIARMSARFQQSERCRLIARLIVEWYATASPGLGAPELVLHEWPQIYQRPKSKGDPNKLIPLAVIGTAVAARFDVEGFSVEPDEWIGSIKKDDSAPDERAWESPRGQLVHRRLGVLERSVVVVSHDAVDAAGIGLWGLGRLERVLIGTT